MLDKWRENRSGGIKEDELENGPPVHVSVFLSTSEMWRPLIGVSVQSLAYVHDVVIDATMRIPTCLALTGLVKCALSSIYDSCAVFKLSVMWMLLRNKYILNTRMPGHFLEYMIQLIGS